jgi:hypothetical protein
MSREEVTGLIGAADDTVGSRQPEVTRSFQPQVTRSMMPRPST